MVSIELDKITFSYPNSAEGPLFSNFSLNIAAGEWVVVVGPSGAGKTTLIKLIKGLLRPQTGEIRVNGTILAPGELNHFVSCVFANPENQIISPVVHEEVAFGLENMGLSPETIGIRVEEALRWVGLWERAKDFSHHLSGGEKQRLILAGALAMRKSCLLLDDPLNMADGVTRADILRLLGSIHQRESCTLVHASHLLEEVLNAKRLVAIEQGRLVFDDSPVGFFRERRLVQQLGMEVPAMAELSEILANSALAEAGPIVSLEELLEFLTVTKRRKDNGTTLLGNGES